MIHKISEYISEEKLDKRIREIAAEISKDYAKKEIRLVCILKGSIFYTCELAKRLTVPVTLDFMSVSSYGSGTESSGNTLSKLIPMLKDRNPASIKVTTLLDKPDRREVDMNVDYVGFEIEDKFVVGYGLDYDQSYRDLPYIGIVEL